MSENENMSNLSNNGKFLGYLILFFTAAFVLSSCRARPQKRKLYCDLGSSSTTQKETGIKVTTIAGCGSSDGEVAGMERQIGYYYDLERKGANELLLYSYRQEYLKVTIEDDGKASLTNFNIPNFGTSQKFNYMGADSSNLYIYQYSQDGNAIFSVDSNTLASTKLAGGNRSGLAFGPDGDKVEISARDEGSASSTDALYFIGADNYIMKVELTGTHAVSRVYGEHHNLDELVYITSSNKLLAIDNNNKTIIEVDLNNNNTMKIIAGGVKDSTDARSDDNADPLLATFRYPHSMALSPGGNIYISDRYPALVNLDPYFSSYANTFLIKKLAINNGVYGAVTTIVGTDCNDFNLQDTIVDENGHHNAREARLCSADDLVFDGNSLYLLDGNSLGRFIRKVEFLDATP